jgi:glycosyltransferase involved in cell wall biosynthesis
MVNNFWYKKLCTFVVMKIGYDAKRAFMNFTGLGVYSRNIIHSLSKSNQVFLFTPRVKIPFISKSQRVQIVEMNGLLPMWISSLWRTFYLHRLVNSERVDIYHGLSAELPCGLNSRIKKVVTIHDLLFERYPQDYPLLDRFFARRKARYACHSADKIIAISDSTRDDIVHYYSILPTKIEVIPVPIEIESVTMDKVLHDRPYIVCVSSFMPRKNQALLIKAFQAVFKERQVDLILIGSGRAYLNECKGLVETSFNDRIVFKSGLSNEELISYYKGALFSVYPSKFEGFGIPIVESIGYRCPILVSDNKTHLEVGENYVSFFTSDNQESLENALVSMMVNIDSIRQGQLARREEILNKYAPEKIRQKISSLYLSLVSS